jgi:enhanced filamentous growth protein 1
MAAAERRKQEQNLRHSGSGPAPGGVLPSITQQHHHHMGLPGPQPPLPSQSNTGRPSLDRAHTFPTPPTSTSSVMGGMPSSETYQWSQQGMNGPSTNNGMTIDTGLSNAARSMPATPATTPPGSSLQSITPYPQGTQAYDNTRGLYSGPTSQQSPYPPANNSPQDRNSYGQANAYLRGDMAPPAGRPAVTGEQDVKPLNSLVHPGQHGEQVSQPGGEEEAEHEAEYTHDSRAYDTNQSAYNYTSQPVASLQGEHAHLSPEMTGSPNHQAGSGRATPRTAAPPQPFYAQQGGYTTSPRAPNSSSLYNVMSSDRGSANGAPGGDVYGTQNEMPAPMQNGYAPQPLMNGGPGGIKRGRDDEDDLARPSSGGMDLKRRKTMIDPLPVGVYDMNRSAPAISQRRR